MRPTRLCRATGDPSRHHERWHAPRQRGLAFVRPKGVAEPPPGVLGQLQPQRLRQILRFGDGRSLRTLRNCYENRNLEVPFQCVRAAGIVCASYGVEAFEEMRRAAGAMLRNHLSTLVRLVAEIQSFLEVPDRYKNRLSFSFDSVAGRKYVDMRVLLMARLLLLSKRHAVRNWVQEWRDTAMREEISDYDRRLISRLIK